MSNRLAGSAVIAVALCAVVAALAAAPGGAKGPPRDDKPVKAICHHQGGSYLHNTIWGWDTTGVPYDVGYVCVFGWEGAAMPSPTEVIDHPSIRRVQALCAAAGGSYYWDYKQLSPIPYPNVAYYYWGCAWYPW
jgi:hypothetical protein